MAKISNITFKNFRVYQEESFTILPNKNIILLYGRNGSGKSSFFDGIEWGLTGMISRYENTKTSIVELNRSEVILKNINAKSKDISSVQITFDDLNAVKRNTTSKYKAKTDYSPGELNSTIPLADMLVQAEMKDISFVDNFNFSHLLAQEQISDFIRATDETKRFEAIVRLFGLDSYKRFDQHIKEFSKHIASEKKSTEAKIQFLISEIEKLNAKISQIELDPQVSKNRIETWLMRSVEINEIDVLINDLNTEHSSLLEQKNTLSNTFQELKLLEAQFERIKETKTTHSAFLAKRKELESIIEILTQFDNCNKAALLKDSYDASVHFEQEHNTKLDRYNELVSFRNNSPLFKDSTPFNQCIEIVASEQPELTEKKDSLSSLATQIDIKKSDIENLKEKLDTLANTTQHLISSALQYFQAFPETNKCPVCDSQSTFNLTESQIRLKTQLEQSGNDALLAVKEILTTENEKLNTIVEEHTDLQKAIRKIIDAYKKSISDDINSLNSEVANIKEIREKANQFIELYGILELATPLDTALFTNHYISVKSELLKHSLYNSEKHSLQYSAELQNIKAELKKLNNEIQEYDGLWNKLAIENVLSIADKIAENTAQSKNCIEHIGSTEGLQKDLAILKASFSNSDVQSSIEFKKTQCAELKKIHTSIQEIERNYEQFGSAVKATINEELDNKLEMYREKIKDFFKYLNPHMYMTELDLKFEPTPGNKGRLYLNVKDEAGKELNPAFTFSAAQNNVLALSIFLSFALKQTWSKLDSIFLDDPIQNMDDINVHAFVDIIRSTIRQKPEKQFFISTHDDRVFNFMKNKFGHDKVQVFEFESYGRIKKLEKSA